MYLVDTLQEHLIDTYKYIQLITNIKAYGVHFLCSRYTAL